MSDRCKVVAIQRLIISAVITVTAIACIINGHGIADLYSRYILSLFIYRSRKFVSRSTGILCKAGSGGIMG